MCLLTPPRPPRPALTSGVRPPLVFFRASSSLAKRMDIIFCPITARLASGRLLPKFRTHPWIPNRCRTLCARKRQAISFFRWDGHGESENYRQCGIPQVLHKCFPRRSSAHRQHVKFPPVAWGTCSRRGMEHGGGGKLERATGYQMPRGSQVEASRGKIAPPYHCNWHKLSSTGNYLESTNQS